ncbi:hypothetical protein QR685DRAFT_574154 [Neurospora intermedia]|uniref:Uncharacterized protein n=1 Tax=Neurospora intermedia TaxID=5142 RepID=A0ABR3D5R6_NEUIN
MVPSSCRPFTSLLCISSIKETPPPRSYSPLPLLVRLPSIRSCYARSKAQLLPCVLGTLVPPYAVITSHNRLLQGFWRLARAWMV